MPENQIKQMIPAGCDSNLNENSQNKLGTTTGVIYFKLSHLYEQPVLVIVICAT